MGSPNLDSNPLPVFLVSGDVASPGYGSPLLAGAAILPAGINRSGTAGTSSATLAAANTARRGLNIQNVSANTIGINEFGGTAAIGSAGTYTIAAGGSREVRTQNAVTIIASAAGSAYTATEY